MPCLSGFELFSRWVPLFTAIFEPEKWIKRPILSAFFIVVGKPQYKQDLQCSSSPGQNCYTTSPSCLVRLHFSNTYLIARLVFIWPVWRKQYPWANIQNIIKAQQNCNIVSGLVILSLGGPSILWVVSTKTNKKIILFWIHRFFSQRNPNDPDFWSDLWF